VLAITNEDEVDGNLKEQNEILLKEEEELNKIYKNKEIVKKL